MEVSGTYQFQAPAAQVWEKLMDPDSLSACIPGCESFRALGDDQYEAVLNVGVGAVRGRYSAKISLRDQHPGRSYRLVMEGSGAIGFASGESLVTLEEQDGVTTVQVSSDAQAGGAVARVGQRMMGSVAKSMLDRMFTCLQQSVG